MYNVIRHKEALTSPVLNAGGEYVVSAQNITRTPQNVYNYFTVASNCFVTDVTFTGVWGSNYYSGSGVIEWWAKESPKTYEIDGLETMTTDEIPALGYGYLKVTVAERVYGCTDPDALNYNPDANTDDGSCFYFSDCGCKDITATNYNPDAPCQDNTKCEYAPECLKKRWLFPSLPCKPSTRNCNCSTTKIQ
jgi:hypothetical protein